MTGTNKIERITSGWIRSTSGTAQIDNLVQTWLQSNDDIVTPEDLDLGSTPTTGQRNFRTRIGAGIGNITQITTSGILTTSGGGTSGPFQIRLTSGQIENITSGWISGATGTNKIERITSGWISGATNIIKPPMLDADTGVKKTAFRTRIGAGIGNITQITTSGILTTSGGGTSGPFQIRLTSGQINTLASGYVSGWIASTGTGGGVDKIERITSGWIRSTGGTEQIDDIVNAVSYTHLTLPTKRIV